MFLASNLLKSCGGCALVRSFHPTSSDIIYPNFDAELRGLMRQRVQARRTTQRENPFLLTIEESGRPPPLQGTLQRLRKGNPTNLPLEATLEV